jgi:CRISPR/Cas system-associated protein Cas10 (large subunit of type III CRISPR-Cas system)
VLEGRPPKKVKELPECEICGEESDKLIKCKSCGAKFCEDCGSPIEKLCEFCAEEEEVDEKDLEDVDEEVEADSENDA